MERYNYYFLLCNEYSIMVGVGSGFDWLVSWISLETFWGLQNRWDITLNRSGTNFLTESLSVFIHCFSSYLASGSLSQLSLSESAIPCLELVQVVKIPLLIINYWPFRHTANSDVSYIGNIPVRKSLFTGLRCWGTELPLTCAIQSSRSRVLGRHFDLICIQDYSHH